MQGSRRQVAGMTQQYGWGNFRGNWSGMITELTMLTQTIVMI